MKDRDSLTVQDVQIKNLEVEIQSIEIALDNAMFRQEAADLRAKLARKSGELKAMLRANQ